MAQAQGETVSATGQAEEAGLLLRRIALIALASIALGFVIQGAVLAIKLTGGQSPAPANIAADVAQGITWAVLVCVGVGVVTTVIKARPLIAGIVSMLIAPLAVALAKSSQKVMSGLLSAAEQPAVLSLATVSLLKAVGYGLLGWLLARLVQRGEERAVPYLASGAAIGVVFGGAISWLAFQAAIAKGLEPGTPQIVSGLINEVVFPIGCAGVIYVGQMVGRGVRLLEGQGPQR